MNVVYNRFITSLGCQNKVSYTTQLRFVMYDDIHNSASLRLCIIPKGLPTLRLVAKGLKAWAIRRSVFR